jgi:ankyrin repeat protein
MFAINNGKIEMAKMLLAKPGIDVSINNKQGKTALSLSKDEDYDELVALINSKM